jgi:hypothetical protein
MLDSSLEKEAEERRIGGDEISGVVLGHDSAIARKSHFVVVRANSGVSIPAPVDPFPIELIEDGLRKACTCPDTTPMRLPPRLLDHNQLERKRYLVIFELAVQLTESSD